jgi:hypothetical protein
MANNRPRNTTWREKMVTMLKITERSVPELKKLLKVSDTIIRRYLEDLIDRGEAHIKSYKHIVTADGKRHLTAMYIYGPGKNAEPPKSFAQRRARLKQFNASRAKQIASNDYTQKVSCYGGLWGLA